ncbi:ferredoxin [Amycolatopsis thermophila]|uniref:Ferredoxin n=2 Tax=Amycolatopsis thermophila TaxID=206084 RepID=A0ABU0F720_9PSEU|nr:ferredoxin [Amycolatopsis thermophila]
MRIKVDPSQCQGYARCLMIDEDVFPLDDEGCSAADGTTVSPERRGIAQEAGFVPAGRDRCRGVTPAPRDPAVVVEEFLASVADLRRTEPIRTCLHAVVQDVMKASRLAIEAVRGRRPGATGIAVRAGSLAVRGQ